MRAVVLLFCSVAAIPLAEKPDVGAESSPLVKLSDGDKFDNGKHTILYVFDLASCEGDKAERCAALEGAVTETAKSAETSADFASYKSQVHFAKLNKDDFPKYRKEFEKAKVALPIVVFWPADHFRPTAKFDSPNPTPGMVSEWVKARLLEESPSAEAEKKAEGSSLVCTIGEPVPPATSVTCTDEAADPSNPQQNLVQVERTQQVWDFKTADLKFSGPADNSLPYRMTDAIPAPIYTIDGPAFQQLTKQGKYQALLFHAPWCPHCSCLGPIWQRVSNNLVGSRRQPDLVVGEVDGDAATDLRILFNVTAYPSFFLVNKDGTKVLGRYLGPRKAFELSNWIEDLIVADSAPITKHQFDIKEEGPVADLNPVYPYTGPAAYKPMPESPQALLAVSAALLMGNDIDTCVEGDQSAFAQMDLSWLVDTKGVTTPFRALEMDSSIVSLSQVPSKLTVVDFFAPWCPHCQHLSPVWDEVAAHYGDGDVVVGKVDVEAHTDVRDAFGIHRFPTIMYFEAGKPMTASDARRFAGQRTVASLVEWIDKAKASK